MNDHVQKLISALSNPTIYPHHPQSVQVIQTHISIVFLAGNLVYKIKKPLSLGFLDYSTLEKRKFFCHQEVELNSRFSTDIYLGVKSVNESAEVGINLDGIGPDVDYAVLMRFVPDNKILKNALTYNRVDLNTIDRVAECILDCHSKASSGPAISVFGAPDIINQNVLENFIQTKPFIGKTIPVETYDMIKRESLGFLKSNREFLEQRVKGGHIRDCHGDLHLDHVVLFDPIMLIDCIEFNDRFRYSDYLSDLAFLLMDLDFSGYPAFSSRALSTYMRGCPDKKSYDLLRFYQSYRAYVRGKVESFKLDESEIDEKTKFRSTCIAKDYFGLSKAYFSPPPPPTLVITCGLMGSGKSFLASRLASRLGIDAIRSDVIRKESLGIDQTQRILDNYGSGIYTRELSDRTYLALFDEARMRLGRGSHVIIDASFSQEKFRTEARKLARNVQARFILIHCEADDHVIRERLIERAKDGREPSDGRWEIYHSQKADFQKVRPGETDGYFPYTPDMDINKFLTLISREMAFGFKNSDYFEQIP